MAILKFVFTTACNRETCDDRIRKRCPYMIAVLSSRVNFHVKSTHRVYSDNGACSNKAVPHPLFGDKSMIHISSTGIISFDIC